MTCFIREKNGIACFAFQVSLPRLVYGDNYAPLPEAQLSETLGKLVESVARCYPEFQHIDLGTLYVSRLDFAFDLPVPVTRTLLEAMRDCPARQPNPSAWIFESRQSSSFYAKDVRGRARGLTYRGLTAYGKPKPQQGESALRVEVKLMRQALSRYANGPIELLDLPHHYKTLVSRAWDYPRSLFEFLRPVDEPRLKARLLGTRVDIAERVQDLAFFLKEVPTHAVLDLLSQSSSDRSALLRLMRRYRLGFGDLTCAELQTFADVLDDINSLMGCPY